jgi:hypothetical protein
MTTKLSRSTLDRLLKIEAFSGENLAALVAGAREEDQWLEYKDGQVLEKPDAATVLREYVTGFANADGGTLVVGVTKAREIAGARAPGRTTLTEWASTVLAGYASQMDPFPQILSVAHGGTECLVVATDRAADLIPYDSRDQPKYSLRINELTVDLPPYLVTDLLLGRRRHPTFRLFDVEPSVRKSDDGPMAELSLQFRIENASLVPADEVRVGAIARSTRLIPEPAPEFLLRHVEVVEAPAVKIPWPYDAPRVVWTFTQSKGRTHSDTPMRPFDIVGDRLQNFAQVPIADGHGVIQFALYVMAKGSPPDWYQGRWEYGLRGTAPMTATGKLTIEPLRGERPKVGWFPR